MNGLAHPWAQFHEGFLPEAIFFSFKILLVLQYPHGIQYSIITKPSSSSVQYFSYLFGLVNEGSILVKVTLNCSFKQAVQNTVTCSLTYLPTLCFLLFVTDKFWVSVSSSCIEIDAYVFHILDILHAFFIKVNEICVFGFPGVS